VWRAFTYFLFLLAHKNKARARADVTSVMAHLPAGSYVVWIAASRSGDTAHITGSAASFPQVHQPEPHHVIGHALFLVLSYLASFCLLSRSVNTASRPLKLVRSYVGSSLLF
jgi:hypothetical protein